MTTLTIPNTGCLDAALIMFRNTPETKDCSFLFVEGEGDEKFWNGRIAEKMCCVVFVVSFENNNQRKTGKLEVIKNVRQLNNNHKSKINGFLGIIDNDFDALVCFPKENNLCVTDTHDLETLLLYSPSVFKKLLGEFGDSSVIANFEKNLGKTVQNYLLELALPFAQIEWLKQNLQPELQLKELHKNETVLIRHKWQLNTLRLYELVKNAGIDVDSPQSKQLLTTVENVSPWLLCNGHVMTEILGIGFQNGALGNNKNATSERISSYLRAAIDKNELYQTELCQSVFNWQKINVPYTVLS